MFFTSIQALLASCQGISLSVTPAANAGNLSVTVIPLLGKDGEKVDAALKTPLNLVGTPAELDAEFAQLIATFTEGRKSLAEQLEAATTIMEAAKKASAASTAKAAGKAAAKQVATPAVSADSEDEESEDDGLGGGDTGTGGTATAAPTVANTNLFDA